MSPIKEPNFFSYDETVRQNLYHKEKGVSELVDYKKLFSAANGHHKAIGEASVSYLFYPSVPARIKEFAPGARIIISLRDPVERAFSHYYMEHKLGYVKDSFEDILYKKSKHKYAHLWYQQYIELGMYYEQVKRYIDQFGKDNVRVFIYDDFTTDIEGSILAVLDFLKIDNTYMPDSRGRYNTYSTPRNKFFHFLYSQKRLRTFARKLLPEDRIESIKNLFLTRDKKATKKEDIIRSLRKLYKPDIQKLEKLLDRNLGSWYE